jgi:phage shock protein C
MNRDWASSSRSARLGIYRNTRCGWISGVCCGIADRLGVAPIWVRAAFVILGLAFHAIPAILLYVAATLLLEPRSGTPGQAAPPRDGYPGDPGPNPGPSTFYFADRLYPSAAAPPPPTTGQLSTLGARFAALDARLNTIEAAVTSDDLALRRKFRDLGG